MTEKKLKAKLRKPAIQGVYKPALSAFGKAFDLYLTYKPFSYISRACSIPNAYLKRYAKNNNWEEQRDELARKSQENSVATFRKVQESNLIEVATRQLDLTQKIDEHIERALQKKIVGVRQLKDLSSTLANTADISGKIVGINRLTSQDGQKALLVQFNMKVNSAGSVSETSRAIEVSSVPDEPKFLPEDLVDIETNPPF